MENEELKMLQERLQLAHESIARLTVESLEAQVLLRALLHTHPNGAALAATIETEKERLVAQALSKTIPDAELEWVQTGLEQAVQRIRRGLLR